MLKRTIQIVVILTHSGTQSSEPKVSDAGTRGGRNSLKANVFRVALVRGEREEPTAATSEMERSQNTDWFKAT